MASPTQPSPSAIYATVSTISHDGNHSSSSGSNNHANHGDGHVHIRGGSSGSSGYKRASRKGAPRRFQCEHAGCDKIYSRAEHLQRHQLNHNPREIYRCDVSDCNQKFVRLDLLSRHKKRHSATYTSRNRVPSFDVGDNAPVIIKSSPCRQTISTSKPSQPPFYPPPTASSGPHDAAILLTPESNNGLVSQTSQSAAWATSLEERPGQASVMRQRPSFYGADAAVSLPDSSDMVSFGHVPAYPSDDALGQGNFAAWLFDPQTTYDDFGVASLPFLEGGLESTFNNNIHYDYESLTSLSPMDLPSRHVEGSEDWISESRRQELIQWFLIFRKKQPSFDARMPNLVLETAGDMSAPTLEMMRDCLKEFWDTVSPRLPIVHQHTFSSSQCPVFLLLVMLALGASSLRSRDTSGQLAEYGAFADLIISCVRWEILTSDDSTPPASLWVAQALLLLEFYEKLLTSRKLHERAHIYHPAYLTLLRRGSPLIGKTGSESPPEPDCLGPDGGTASINLDSRTWWARWAETESMHRVVFAAFMLDIIHAAMFGHAADMAAHEIRLPLPCDDNLWTASSPDVVRQLDANFRMYGVRQVSFLDGLKSALHGKEVMTHSFGRMIIISGLLSVGWHLNHRETHLKWLDLRVPPADETQDSWRRLLLRAFDGWKDSFDVAMSQTLSDPAGNGPISSASVLYHLAHMSLHADIVDCQVYAGARRLLGRKVSSRDYANAVKRMTVWAKQASTRHAILHAFRLLQRVLVDQPRQRAAAAAVPMRQVRYSVKMDTDPHRPWITYYAVLAIWAFVRALGSRATMDGNKHHGNGSGSAYARMAEYVSGVARLAELDEATAAGLHEGLPGLLDVMEDILQEADTELLAEARQRLRTCREMLAA